MTTKFEQDYVCNHCDHSVTMTVTYQESYDFCDSQCPKCDGGKMEKYMGDGGSATFIYDRSNRSRIPRALRDKLNIIKKAHPRSTMPDY